jgi:hypothetical protein
VSKDQSKGKEVEIKAESDYLQKVWKGQPVGKITGRQTEEKST